MTNYLNEHDIRDIVLRFDASETMNRLRVGRLVARLMEETNKHSDGWAYWRKPCQSAQKAIELVAAYTYLEREALEETDATDAEVKAALAPIKSFLTRYGTDAGMDRRYILGEFA